VFAARIAGSHVSATKCMEWHCARSFDDVSRLRKVAARRPARHKSRRGEHDSKRPAEWTFVCDAEVR
jgi:hypothetical protein